MDGSQNTLAVISVAASLTYVHVGAAMRLAGWEVLEASCDDGDAVAAASMIVVDGMGEVASLRRDHIVAAVMEGGRTPSFPVDLVVDPDQGVERLAAIFSQWLPPGTASLARMATMFGRDGLLPVVEGLRAELEMAIEGAEGHSAHRIAGLTGTLGFTVASESWQAVDLGTGGLAAALRDSRTALIAIDRWLAATG